MIGSVYAWVRNPIYLGGFLTLAGLGLVRRSPGLLGRHEVSRVLTDHAQQLDIVEPRVAGAVDRTDHLGRSIDLQRLVAARQRLIEHQGGGLRREPVDRIPVDARHRTQLPK